MAKFIKYSILIILVAAAGAFIFFRYHKPAQKSDNNLESMKTSIIADPVINAPGLTEEQKAKFINEFKTAKKGVLDANFDTLDGLNVLALAKKHLGDLEGAAVAWNYANIIRPKNSLSFANLAALYHFDLKQYDKAEQNYEIAFENDPTDLPTIRNYFELYYYALKDNQKAEALLLRAIALNPKAQDLYSLAGSFYQETGNAQKAIEYYEKNLALNPGNVNVQRELDKLKAAQQ